MIDCPFSFYGSGEKDFARIYASKFMVISFFFSEYVVEKSLQNSHNLACQWETQLNIF